MEFGTELRFLKGAGPARAARLVKLGLETVGDLLEHYPRAYLDRLEALIGVPIAIVSVGPERTQTLIRV